MLAAEANVLHFLWKAVDSRKTRCITREQFIQAMWLIWRGCEVTLVPTDPRVADAGFPVRKINGWTTCDACSRMLIPRYHVFGCKTCTKDSIPYYFVCQTCIRAQRVCHHFYSMLEFVLVHDDQAPAETSKPRVLEDGKTTVYFACSRCHEPLPAGSTSKYCSKDAPGKCAIVKKNPIAEKISRVQG